MTQAPLSVLLKTWNTGEATRLLLDAIGAADLLPEEIVIVDLGEDAATRDHAETLAARHEIALRWLPVGHRLAPGAGNRLALDAATSPLICLLDNDVLVPRNWLGPLVALLADPDVGLVAPIRPDTFLAYPGRSDLKNESSEAVLDAIKERGLPLAEVAREFTGGRSLAEFGRAFARANDLDTVVPIEFPSLLSTCCVAFDRAVVEEAGGIADPAFDAGYGSEDVDLTWRVLAAGYECLRTAEVFILHFRHTSLAANGLDFGADLVAANRVLYARWRKRLLAWARYRLKNGDSVDDLVRRFIVRELLRNTAFAADLGVSGSPAGATV